MEPRRGHRRMSWQIHRLRLQERFHLKEDRYLRVRQ